MYDWGIFSKRKTCGSTDKPSCVTGVNSCRSLLLSGSLLLRKEWAVSADMILLGCCGDCLQSRASLSLWAEMCLKKSVCFKYSCIVLPCTDKGGCFLLKVSLVLRRWQEHWLTAGELAAGSVLCYNKTQVQLCSCAFLVGQHKWNIFLASSEAWCNSDWNNAHAYMSKCMWP